MSKIRESDRIKLKYPDRVPVIVDFDKNFVGSEHFKTKYLVPRDMTCSQFQYVLKKRMLCPASSDLRSGESDLRPDEAMFMFINKRDIPIASSLMGDVYEKNKRECGFLYISVVKENVFG
jgi:GABA(A) receptor-associated protein